MKNNIKCWICENNKITYLNIVNDIKVKNPICNNCYFLFTNTNLSKIKKINYYSNIKKSEIDKRYFANEYLDTARFINYINLILKKNCKLKDKINHLDIGGGFGFFSKVLKNQFPKINSFNLEPDKSAIRVAKKFNKSVKTINLPFEEIHLLKDIKFDLVTYWGGIYRTIEPNKVFKDLKKICNNNCDFFFSLPTTLEDMRVQHLELKNTFDDSFISNDGIKGLFGKNHMRLFLSKIKFFFKEFFIQNKPFKKKVPIFHFNLKKKTKKFEFKKTQFKRYFKENICIYNDYFEDEIKKTISKKNTTNKIIIIGDNFLSRFALNFLKKKNIKRVINIKYQSKDLFFRDKELAIILNLSNDKDNIFLIFENLNSKLIKNSLIKRLHLNLNNDLYSLSNNFKYENEIFLFDKKELLKKKINLVKL